MLSFNQWRISKNTVKKLDAQNDKTLFDEQNGRVCRCADYNECPGDRLSL